MSLRVKIIGSFLLIALIPYSVIALFVYVDIEQAASQSALDRVSALATIQKSRTMQVLAAYRVQLEQFLTRLQLRRELAEYEAKGDAGSLAAVTSIIEAARRGTPDIDNVYVLTSDGIIVASTEKDAIGRDASGEIFFRKGSVANDVSTLVKVRGIVYAYLSGPLVVGGKTVGVVALRVKTDDLFGIFRDYTGLGATGSWGLAQRAANGDALIIVPGRFDANPDSPLTSRLADTPQNANTPLMHALSGEERTFPDLTNYLGHRVAAATRYIPEAGWGIGVTQDRGEIFAPSRALALQLVLFSALLIIFIALLSVGISQVILRPIRRLSLAAKRAASGDLSRPITAHSDDELGVLAVTFNEMLSQLHVSRERLEEKVRERTAELQKFQHAVANASDLIVITDANGVILYANDAVERITGFSREEILGHKSGSPELWGGLMEKAFYRRMWQTIKHDKQTFTDEIGNKRKDGSRYYAAISISPVLNNAGDVEYFVELQHDMTKEKQIDKAKTEFVSLASHQLRTPTTAIRWYTEMMLNEKEVGPLNNLQRKYLKGVYRSGRRMIDLVNSLLNVSRIELGTFALSSKRVDVSALIHGILEDLSRLITERSVSVRYEPPEREPIIHTDPQWLRVVLQNLITNAIEYTSAGGAVTCAVSLAEDGLQISVEDSGCGIPRDAQSKIFGKFFRADNARVVKPDGNGLGLYITKSIVDALGGRIRFVSEEGKGAIFYVALPLHGHTREGPIALNLA